jgi:hypothetical protein
LAVAEDLARVPQGAAIAVGELKPRWIVKVDIAAALKVKPAEDVLAGRNS